MIYELAKQLKHAGFPQNVVNRIHYRNDCEECKGGNHEKAMSADLLDEYDIAIPTLSELIEACGERFENLTFYEGKWLANAWYIGDGIGSDISGQTPEEAVAKLWIELNKK